MKIIQRFTTSILLVLLMAVVSAQDASCAGGDVRVIQMSELQTKAGAGGEGDVWISFLGLVYDVTSGRRFYGEGAPYSVFAAKDATGSLASGKFDEESANAVNYAELKKDEVDGLKHWKQFYAGKEEYVQIGVLEGKFYDAKGAATDLLTGVLEQLQ
uniref:Cytochrome b5 heme-binding domain-containing protein n=1 Tax=Leptocylindrus danicus TaxID=163516 RepID=A0A7S2KVC3_9STRA|mmetsp:Transcript_26881/g.39809  ORF Transcript_26881/g.39809 Transcript_26881/m.39809 type:complete len:157 (+) Transcript_26881:92-562(+)